MATSVAAARHYVASELGGLAPEVLEPIVLMVSELTTNAIRHGGPRFELRLRRDATEVRVEVLDAGPGRPTQRRAGVFDSDGRGLLIVGQLASSWGVREEEDAKAVWFSVEL